MIIQNVSLHEVLVTNLKKEVVAVYWSDILGIYMKPASLSHDKEAFEGMWKKSVHCIESANRNK